MSWVWYVSVINYKSVIMPAIAEPEGVAGILYCNQRRVLLPDLFELFFLLYPQAHMLSLENETYAGIVDGILLLDDSTFFLNYIRVVLQRYGFVVYIAENKQEVLEVLDEYGADIGLLLVDINFSAKGVFELLTEIKKKEDFSDLNILALTALAGEEKRVRYRTSSGIVSDFILKMDFEKIIAACLGTLRARLNRAE